MTDKLRVDARRAVEAFDATKALLGGMDGPVEALVEYARVCLAEHPEDDGKPVTKEWLQGIVNKKDLWILYQGPTMLAHLLAKRSHGIAWVLAGPTRGDVRRLCKALGIELKESLDRHA